MPIYRFPEEFLREDLATASKALDAAGEMLKSTEHLTPAEAKANYKAALMRYATSLRRFSDFVVDGKAPMGEADGAQHW